MGQRANLVIVKNGKYSLHYDHWSANRLDAILFWGIEHALEYVYTQEEINSDDWLDDIGAEGGALIDLDRQSLLWWGGEDIYYDVQLRHAYLKLQQTIWAG